MKNAQGDIIRILDESGTVVVEYTYDSWGKEVSITGSAASTVGELNPYRYRSYRYDTETGLYYLNSRYYDPEVGRFINADHAAVSCFTPMGLTDKNLFAYCDNNPVVRKDADGDVWQVVVIGAFVGGTARLFSNLVDRRHYSDGVVEAAIGGAVFAGMATSAALIIPAAAAAGIIESTARQFAKTTSYDWASGEWNTTGEIDGIEWLTDCMTLTTGYAAGGAIGLKVTSSLPKDVAKKAAQGAGKYIGVTLKPVLEAGTSTSFGKLMDIYYYDLNRSISFQYQRGPIILI